MLIAQGADLVNVGPFFEVVSLSAVLAELAKIIMQAGTQLRLIEEQSLSDYRLMADYLKTQLEWAHRLWGPGAVERTQVDRVQEMVARLEQLKGG